MAVSQNSKSCSSRQVARYTVDTADKEETLRHLHTIHHRAQLMHLAGDVYLCTAQAYREVFNFDCRQIKPHNNLIY